MDITNWLLGHLTFISPVISAFLAIGVAGLIFLRSRKFLEQSNPRKNLGYYVSIGSLLIGILLFVSLIFVINIGHKGTMINKENITALLFVGVWFIIFTVLVYLGFLQGIRITQKM